MSARQQRHRDRIAAINDRIRRRGQAAAMREMTELRPGEVCGTVEPGHDPLRHLDGDERGQILAAIRPRL